MHALRTSAFLARLVLAWFALTLGVAVASPVVHPGSMQLICSDSGMVKLVAIDDDGQPASASHQTLDCSLCLGTAPPPRPADSTVPQVQPLAHALKPHVAAHIAALVGAPFPPRGPPALG